MLAGFQRLLLSIRHALARGAGTCITLNFFSSKERTELERTCQVPDVP